MKTLASLFCAFLVAGLGLPVAATNFASEYELLRQLPTAALSGLITNTGLPDAQGFIGFHQQQGKWIEAGMQRGGCWMLIGAVVAGDEKRADEAWRSIDATFAHQIEDGGFLSVRKPEISHEPTLAERVETAFFYLQELGHAILVVQASPMEGHFHDRIEALKPRMRRACAFIQANREGIVKKVGHTANRLFIAAKAFGLCGIVLNDEDLKASSASWLRWPWSGAMPTGCSLKSEAGIPAITRFPFSWVRCWPFTSPIRCWMPRSSGRWPGSARASSQRAKSR